MLLPLLNVILGLLCHLLQFVLLQLPTDPLPLHTVVQQLLLKLVEPAELLVEMPQLLLALLLFLADAIQLLA